MKKLVIGILAHVDAGKTTLSEGMLYQAGSIRKMGRVDNKDAFLDTFSLERARGITIFSKQAVMNLGTTEFTLLDTPGHVDFSAEMERTLQVLDYAILVISGADGVQGHTRTLWKLLQKYHIPTFLFVNKMDQPGTEKSSLLAELKDKLDSGCVDFTQTQTQTQTQEFYEEIAVCEDALLERFLETEQVEEQDVCRLIDERKVFPCYFGSALKMQGVEEFLGGLDTYTQEKDWPQDFGAKIYKIARDEQGNRLTYMKVTGGMLKVKSMLTYGREEEQTSEKVNQIRIYSGAKYEAVGQCEAGRICAVTGLTTTRPGEGIGADDSAYTPVLEPVLTYQIQLPDGTDAQTMLPKLRELEEEEPELHIVWNERLQEIQAQIMGEVQIEILRSLIAERFGVEVTFGTGNIVYRETITRTVEGVGHFEPLRHYAEVHLLLEPGERGSGLVFAADCSEDMLDRNWQRLVLTHLEEKVHTGVLTGSAITDMKITLVSGRAHIKHTEGGDFRQATYRALRQGLMQAESILLEPYYDFRLEVPQNMVGRAMTDIEKMHGTFTIAETGAEMSVLTGSAPVTDMRGYQTDVIAYTKGHGRLNCTLRGYEPCHNTPEIMEQIGYEAERDTLNPAGSVFCAHGSGYPVPWEQVPAHMHLPSWLEEKNKVATETVADTRAHRSVMDEWIGEEEIEAILSQTYRANTRDKSVPRKGVVRRRPAGKTVIEAARGTRPIQKMASKEEYLLVDGYNIIFAWEDLNALAAENIDSARGKLMDVLSNYQGAVKCNLIVVFDAYRVKGHVTEIFDYHNIHVVYTKEAETADQYIEKFSYEHGHKYNVTVATSDGLEQIIIRGNGCRLFSAREFETEVKRVNDMIREEHLNMQPKVRNYLLDALTEEEKQKLKELPENE